MKRILALAAVFALGWGLSSWQSSKPVHASIQLPAPWVYSGPGVATESDGSVAVTGLHVDVLANAVTLYYSCGTATVTANKTTGFTQGAQCPSVLVTFNLNNNTWLANTPNSQATAMTPGEITAVQAIMTAATTATRNPGESFAVSHSIFGTGTTTIPW
jgi:hypothetical protein